MNWKRLAGKREMTNEPIHTITRRRKQWVNHSPDPNNRAAASVSALYSRPICGACGEEKIFDVALFDFICAERRHIKVTPPKFNLDAWLGEFWK